MQIRLSNICGNVEGFVQISFEDTVSSKSCAVMLV